MTKYIVLLLLVSTTITANAQRRKKKNKKEEIITQQLFDMSGLQKHIEVLASDSLQGRRTGTVGEQLAFSYIRSQFDAIGLEKKGVNNTYLQPFDIFDGTQYQSHSTLFLSEKILQADKDYFPLPYSANASKEEIVSPELKDVNGIWFLDLKDELKKQSNNIHFDINSYLEEKAKTLATEGAGGLLVYNSGTVKDNLAFDTKVKKERLKIPVLYINYATLKKYLPKTNDVVEVKFTVDIKEKTKTGTNVIGFINNNAAKTIIVGAHYDHLGMGEDKNSLHTGNPDIHNGADDNASGVAALITLAKTLKKSTITNTNYLFIAFSGEELGLYGSKYFTENATIDLSKVNYMINMDMVGRLNDSTKAYTIGGYGTSPTWSNVIKEGKQPNGSTIKIDSSGTGPSDHTSFYRKNIPVLFYFTGTHSDYHKPSDDAHKINIGGVNIILDHIYHVITNTDPSDKLVFSKTREQATGGSSTRFTVSLGVMPDYTYSGGGVKVDGVSEGKAAKKLGIQAGDILTKMGDIKIENVESYMKVLSKFKKGDSTTVTTKRGDKEITYNVTF